MYKVDLRTFVGIDDKLSAKIFGLSDRGSLEKGKLADIVILQVPNDGTLLSNISVLNS